MSRRRWRCELGIGSRGPLAGRDFWMWRDERDHLDVLSSLIEKFEESRHRIPAAGDADLLAHLLEARGVTQSEVARDTGIAESTVSAVLKGARTLTRQHIARLAAYFRVSPAAFDLELLRV